MMSKLFTDLLTQIEERLFGVEFKSIDLYIVS